MRIDLLYTKLGDNKVIEVKGGVKFVQLLIKKVELMWSEYINWMKGIFFWVGFLKILDVSILWGIGWFI